MRRKNLKIIIAAGCLACVVFIVIGFLLLAPRSKHRELKDTPYPVTWISRKDGSVLLTVAENGTDAVWNATNTGSQILTAERLEESEAGTAEFTVIPVSDGTVSLYFTLEGEGMLDGLFSDSRCMISCRGTVKDGKVSLSDFQYSEDMGMAEPTATDIGYTARTTQLDGLLYVYLTPQEDVETVPLWNYTLSTDWLAVQDMYYDGEGIVVVLGVSETAAIPEGGADGEAVLIGNREIDEEPWEEELCRLHVRIHADEGKILSLTDFVSEGSLTEE